MSNIFSAIIILTILFCRCSPRNSIDFPDGGYEYPAENEKVDSSYYFYPVRNVASKRDSFDFSMYYRFYQAFDEENLSLAPHQTDVFRFCYEQIMSPGIVITLTPNEIIVKKGNQDGYFDYVGDALTELEEQHLNYLQVYFLANSKRNAGDQKYFDSLTNEFPELLDAKYYKQLIEKRFKIKPFTYSVNKIKISNNTYRWLVTEINRSGYWKFPCSIRCEGAPTHPSSFSLEANTQRKFNVVCAYSCPDDTTRFVRACQELVKAAKMENEIRLIWDGTTITVDESTLPPPVRIK